MAVVISRSVEESLFSLNNFGSMDEDCFTFLSHKDTKNKWKSHKIGKKCRNKQKQSNNNRCKKWKNLYAKRRFCNDLIINSTIESDILNERQSNLEFELTETEFEKTNKKLLILDSPKRRRRGSSKQHNNNNSNNGSINSNSVKSMSISPSLSLSPGLVSWQNSELEKKYNEEYDYYVSKYYKPKPNGDFSNVSIKKNDETKYKALLQSIKKQQQSPNYNNNNNNNNNNGSDSDSDDDDSSSDGWMPWPKSMPSPSNAPLVPSPPKPAAPVNNNNNNNNNGGSGYNPTPARRRAKPEKPKIIDQFPDFNIENELKELGLTEFAAAMLKDNEKNNKNNKNSDKNDSNNNNDYNKKEENNENSENTDAEKMTEKETETKEETKEKADNDKKSILLKLEKKYKESIDNIEEHGEYSSIDGLASYSTFKEYNKTDETTIMDPKRLKKVFKEIQTELPNNIVIQWNGSMFVRFDESNPRFMQALLTGLDDTPYHNGLFLFDIYLHKDYPNTPLNIKHVTKGGNLVYGNHTPGGFSPNLHRDSGKVCLSLLGTWGENQWDKDNSNVYQVLSSILFWILGAKWAYYMEPSYGGWELTAPMNECNFNKHKKDVITYNYEIIEKCMKYAILETIKTPYNGFNDVIKCHFKCKKNEIFYTMLCKWIKNIDNINVENRINIKNKLIPLYYDIKQELLKL